jgi:hypothetical protein
MPDLKKVLAGGGEPASRSEEPKLSVSSLKDLLAEKPAAKPDVRYKKLLAAIRAEMIRRKGEEGYDKEER